MRKLNLFTFIGGRKINDQIEDHKDKGKVIDGDVFMTTAGNLPVRGLIHAVIPAWRGGGRNEDGTLQNAMYEVFCLANKAKARSIAFPPIGIGVFRYSNEIVARVLVQAVKLYIRDVGAGNRLEKIMVFDKDGEFHKYFVNELDSVAAVKIRRPLGKNLKFKVCLLKIFNG